MVSERRLVVEKRARLSELFSEYAYTGADGQPLGIARPFEQSTVGKAARLLTDGRIGQGLELHAPDGGLILSLRRAARLGRTRITVLDGPGSEIGRVEQETLRRVRFEPGGVLEEAADRGVFVLSDAEGRGLARVVRTKQKLSRRLFTKAERYELEVLEPVEATLQVLVVALPLVIDLTFPRDAAGQELVTAFGN